MKRLLKRAFENSIQHARFIDLGIEDTPAAIYTGLRLGDNDESADNIVDAFESCGRRLLVLGAPGSGKSTMLQHLALHLIDQAEHDPDAPVPFVINLSQFRFGTAASGGGLGRMFGRSQQLRRPQEDRRIADWLSQEFARFAKVGQQVAVAWMEEGKISFLLDGLDEVGDERRLEFAELLNQTFLDQYPGIEVVVCSRINEYLPIQQRDSGRLRLGGAATLAELSEADILEYLDKAQVPTLREAIVADGELMNMAQTPLFLCMMTLAYAGLSRQEIPSIGTPAERRHHLMERYTDRMLQRAERRFASGRGIDAPERDIPTNCYRFRPEKTRRYLSWLAVRMSVRMTTSFRSSQSYTFLVNDENAPPQTCDILATNLGLCLFAAILSLAVSLPFILRDTSEVGAIVGTTLAALAVVFAGSLVVSKRVGTAKLENQVGWLLAFILPLGTGLISRSPTVTAFCHETPYSIAILVGCSGFMAFLLKVDGVERKQWPAILMILFAVAITCLPQVVQATSMPANYVSPMVAFAACWLYAMSSMGDLDFESVSAVTICLLVAVGFAIGGVEVVGGSEIAGRTLLTTLSLYTVAAWRYGTFRSLLLAIFATVGASVGATLGLCAGMLLFGVILVTDESDSPQVLRRFAQSFGLPAARVAEAVVISPLVWATVSLTRAWPLRSAGFLSYTRAALLLKSNEEELEFVHRRLRDYFALQDLMARYWRETGEARLQVIESLGYQGESSIDLLADLTREGDDSSAAAAIRSLARIASIDVLAPIAAAAESGRSIEIRRAALRNLRQFPLEWAEAIFLRASEYPEPSVKLSAVRESAEFLRGSWIERDARMRIVNAALRSSQADDDLLKSVLSQVSESSTTPSFNPLSPKSLEVPTWALPRLRHLIQDPDPAVRVGVLKILASGKGGGESVDFDQVSTTALRDPFPEVRLAGVEALGGYEPSQSNPVLIEALSDSDARVCQAAADRLSGRYLVEASDALLRLANSRTWERFEVGAAALAGLGDVRVEPTLRRRARWGTPSHRSRARELLTVFEQIRARNNAP